ncbi:MAG: AbrB/MazE/SpoVT family DNA-binding domain-containing protein [Limnohabitans sp.]|nr:MAG: AbrB/MazE/SpoVT family DNA-binding domain-containing protein [Limnohabitans sp.]
MHVTIRPFGNSKGVIIPKPLLAQVGLQDEAEIEVQDGALVLRPVQAPVRQGWEQAAQAIAVAKEDEQVMGDAPLADEGEWQW